MRLYLLVGFMFAMTSLALACTNYMDILYAAAEEDLAVLVVALIITTVVATFIYPVMIVVAFMDDDVW